MQSLCHRYINLEWWGCNTCLGKSLPSFHLFHYGSDESHRAKLPKSQLKWEREVQIWRGEIYYINKKIPCQSQIRNTIDRFHAFWLNLMSSFLQNVMRQEYISDFKCWKAHMSKLISISLNVLHQLALLPEQINPSDVFGFEPLVCTALVLVWFSTDKAFFTQQC